MHYAIKQLHYAQKIALQRLIDLFSKNDALQSRMFISYLFVILMMNCVFCIMYYAISIMHNAPMHFFQKNLYALSCISIALKNDTPHGPVFIGF